MAFLSEGDLERAFLQLLQSLGYQIAHDQVIGPDKGALSERMSYGDVVLRGRLEAALERFNRGVPEEVRLRAVEQLLQSEYPSLLEENRRLHRILAEGLEMEYLDERGETVAERLLFLDFDSVEANDWLAVEQFTVMVGENHRRPDVVLFVNGLPVVVVELKSPSDELATLDEAFSQLQTYKREIEPLFRTNGLLVISDGMEARVGSLSADRERFMPWRTIDGESISEKGSPELEVVAKGTLDRRRLLDLFRSFTVFNETESGLIKIIAGYHQYHAVLKAVESTLRASAPSGVVAEDPLQYGLASVDEQEAGDRRAGVIWHTQGSGKSLLMAFYAGQLIGRAEMANPTLVVLTDRNDLDDQLFSTFTRCKDLLRQTPVQASDRDDLKKQLNRASGGVIFSTLQKFEEVGEALTDRSNVVVIVDEAHRSQYGFGAKVDRKTGAISYGFAKHLRDALPRATFIGFTGTPIEKGDVNTPAVFGNYIDIYDINRAVEDGATVPIHYESRLAKIELDEEERPKIDHEVAELTEDDSEEEREELKRKWTTVEALVGSEKRLAMVASDLVEHFEKRTEALAGKGMVVCMSRRICVALYNEIVRLRPDWHSDDDTQGAVKVVMTGSAGDPQEWQPHIGNKRRREHLAKRARDPEDPLRLVLVRDMWLTGFDAPCMHTMYIDKPMQGHGLMQAIARVNRVFRDKPAGLIVDYIGVAQNLKAALGQYSPSDQKRVGIDQEACLAQLQERYEVVRDMFHGFDYLSSLKGTEQERFQAMAGGMDWVLRTQQKLAAQEESEEGKKRAHRRYNDAVLALSKAFALASASDEAAEIREEIGFFQAIRAALAKSSGSFRLSQRERELAIRQIVSRAVVSTEIIDILAAVGFTTPDISILSDPFLDEIRNMKQKNLAIEALRKLLNDDIRSRSASRMVESKEFSRRLEEAIARYHSNALTTAEVMQRLIDLAKDLREAHSRGEELGLSPEEIAFYDALAENKSAIEVMGNDQLKVIAMELLNSLRENVTVDWMHRESARARLRVMVKRVLKKYGYPPDLEDAAVQTVLRQAEALTARWDLR